MTGKIASRLLDRDMARIYKKIRKKRPLTPAELFAMVVYCGIKAIK